MTYPGLPANWTDGTTQFHAANENAVEAALNTLSGFSTKTANYTLQTTDQFIAADATSGSIIQTLPNAVGIAGKRFTIKKFDPTVNTVTVATTSSQTIDGVGSHLLVFANQRVTVVSNGTNWLVVESNYAGTELGFAALMGTSSLTYTNALVTDAALSSNKLPGLSVTTIGVGRPVRVEFQGNAYNTTANAYASAQLLINNSAVGGAGATVSSPSTSGYRTLSFRASPLLSLGVSYTFEVGAWVQTSTTGAYYSDGTTPLPMTLTVVAQ